MGRGSSFRESITNYLGAPKTPTPTEPTDDFSLPPEQEAYYKGQREGMEHRDKLKELKGTAAKNQYVRGIREGLKQDDKPKRGDLDNPLKKDMPKPARQPAAPRARQQNPLRNVRKMQSLARKASGGKRRW